MALLQVAQNAADIGVWSWEIDSGKLDWDERLMAWYEVPEAVRASGLFYAFWTQRVHPDDAAKAEAVLRAAARAALSLGHSAFSGNCSATYSAMAKLSQTVVSPSRNSGTVPVGLTAVMVRLNSDWLSKLSKRTYCSSKGMPAWRSSTQARMDQEE